jgi:Cys-rich repeat protein
VIAIALAGCGPSVAVPGGETAEASTGDGTTAAPPVTSSSSSTTSTSSSSEDSDVATFSTADPTTSSTGDPPFTSTDLISDTAGGGPCQRHDECESGMCFMAGILGGICSDCLTDADCRWGCSLPNPLTDPPTGATCNDGLLGEGCETSDACVEGLLCAPILELPGVLSVRTCSECLADTDCAEGAVCTIDLRIDEIAGERECVAAGSKPNGEFCDLEGDGDECTSTHCSGADIMGLAEVGVCGECSSETGEGCDAGQSCNPPSVDLDGTVLVASCA